jgi:hypothetical protein
MVQLPLPSHAVRLPAAWVANARAAGAGAFTLSMTAGSAPIHTALAVGHGRERGRSLLVTPRGGGLGTRQAHGSIAFCRQCGTRQQRGDNDTQDKTHDAPPFLFWRQRTRVCFGCSAGEGSSSAHHIGLLSPEAQNPPPMMTEFMAGLRLQQA